MQNNVGIYASQISGHLWAPQGAYDALATVTVPSGGAASVTFTGIPQGYKHLQIRFLAKSTRTNVSLDELNFRINGDSGSNYAIHYLFGTGSGAASATYNTSWTYGQIGYGTLGDDLGGQFGVGIIDILDSSSTSKYKTVRSLSGVDMNGTGGGSLYGRVGLTSNLWQSTSAINSLAFYAVNGNFTQYTQFALYGIK